MHKLYFSISDVQCSQIQPGLYCHTKLHTTKQWLDACHQRAVKPKERQLSGVRWCSLFWKYQGTTIVPVVGNKIRRACVKPIQFDFPINKRKDATYVVHRFSNGLFDHTRICFENNGRIFVHGISRTIVLFFIDLFWFHNFCGRTPHYLQFWCHEGDCMGGWLGCHVAPFFGPLRWGGTSFVGAHFDLSHVSACAMLGLCCCCWQFTFTSRKNSLECQVIASHRTKSQFFVVTGTREDYSVPHRNLTCRERNQRGLVQ